jgi:hypothetical protein
LGSLPARDKRFYLSVLLWLIAVRAALTILPFRHVYAWLSSDRRAVCDLGPLEERDRIVLAVERIGRALAAFGVNCLPQALVGNRLLRRAGYDVQLRIGVRKNRHGRLAAHAWLEHRGEVILGELGNLGQFTVFARLEGVAP